MVQSFRNPRVCSFCFRFCTFIRHLFKRGCRKPWNHDSSACKCLILQRGIFPKTHNLDFFDSLRWSWGLPLIVKSVYFRGKYSTAAASQDLTVSVSEGSTHHYGVRYTRKNKKWFLNKSDYLHFWFLGGAPDSAAFAPELPIKETTLEHSLDLG